MNYVYLVRLSVIGFIIFVDLLGVGNYLIKKYHI